MTDSKAERITKVRNTLDTDTLLERLPEIDTIFDESIRRETIKAFLKACPEYFWEIPSSGTGKYHAEDERGTHGNWIHTKRVYVTYLVHSRSYLEQGLITEFERDAGKSAALLHDMLKFGWLSEREEYAVSNHDVIASDVAREMVCLPRETWGAIHAHNGAWGDGKNPQTEWEQLFHMADYTASKQVLGKPCIWNPHELITDEYPDIKTISSDSFEELL